ncbi:MAG: RES domain-containing protein [Vicinamibacteria bacterium]|nr:RES domain-containing protein [Vicinamibacteria bacterium]
MSTTAFRSEATVRAYRIGSRHYQLFDGAGAAASDTARWNSRGRRVIYAAEHYATAVLEKLAQLNSVRLPASLAYIEISVPPDLAIERVDPAAIKRWDADDKAASQAFGDRWYDERRTAVLLVPSLAAPGLEWNAAINQRHPDFARLSASALRPVVAPDHVRQ